MTDPATPRDPRLTAARRDLAAAKLRGQVEADRFVEGEAFTVLTETSDLKRAPRPDAPVETQLLYGETLIVYDDEDGWGWAQSDRDDYVGYIAMSALGRSAIAATHRVIVNRTLVYPAADMKQPPYNAVPLDGRVLVEGMRGDFAKIRGHGFVFAPHLKPIAETRDDFVAVAEQLIGAPYLWGGKSAGGVDCSGLVQLACAVTGIAMPRDTDMQQAMGDAVEIASIDIASVAASEQSSSLHRGDLVFWRGHVGIMIDATTLLHANAFHMLVAREPLADARQRIRATGSEVTAVRRILKDKLHAR